MPGLGDIEMPETNSVLLHFLSPLELAAYKHFLHKPLKHHHLPTRIHHILKSNKCYNMADVAQSRQLSAGEQGIERHRDMGKTHIVTIIKVFPDNGFGELFL